ncbi:YhcH/YjgK/YiaL family protein [Chitinibacter sp. FCG-7]|uniref:YhcH/YjgK/YiaL family protein n=1 Tax=Chitinibacter mangrovi TaxID=3153927 RepID=A0AAU7FDG8_9NEIS
MSFVTKPKLTMYLSHLHHPQAPLPRIIETALDYLRSTDFSQMEPGRYPLDGEQMIAIVQTPQTQPWETGLPEFHQRYLDIQYVLEGEEIMGYHIAPHTPNLMKDQLAERDIAFVHPIEGESRLHLSAGMFAIFFPGELHKPCRSVTQSCTIKKVVIKIDASLLSA